MAIKYLSSRLLGTPGYLELFRSEASLLRTLDVPQVVRLFDYVEAPGQGAAIIMELVAGVSLHEMIARQGPTGPESALVVLKGSLLGLAAAHALGIVHRDYKPENVLVDGQGTSKLTDFGVAVSMGDSASPGGTPLYMAPEQWNGLPSTPATDIYAATAVFFECLTGQTPFSGGLGQLATQHATAAVPVELVDERLRELIVRGMAKDPAARPGTALEFVAELETMATTAYGADWESTGRRHLAQAAVALLSLLSGTVAAATATTGAMTIGAGAGTATTSTWLGTVTSAIAAHVVLYTGIAAAVVGIVGGSLVAVSRATTSSPASSTAASLATPAASLSPSAATRPTPLSATSAISPPAATPSTTPTPSATPSAASTTGPCQTSGLSVSVDWSAGAVAAGRMTVPLEFTNTSGRTCTLYGFPGVALTQTAPGSQVGSAAERGGGPATVVTLAPGANAGATLILVNVQFYDASSCGPVSAGYLQVYPPGQTSAVYVPNTGYTGEACTKPIQQLAVSTVVSGIAPVP